MHACEGIITGAGADADTKNKQVTFKDCTPFTGYIREINDTQVDYAKEMDVAMLMYYLIEHSYNYMKISGVYGSTTEMIQMITQQILNNLNSR